MGFILQWIDFIWLPVMLVVVPKQKRIMVTGLFIACAVMMRLQIELIQTTGFSTGFLPLMTSNIQNRAIGVYNVFYMLYTIFAAFAPHARDIIFMAASITLFFAAMVVSMVVMIL